MMPDLNFRSYVRGYRPFIIETSLSGPYFLIIDQFFVTLQAFSVEETHNIRIKELYKIGNCSLKAHIYKFLHDI